MSRPPSSAPGIDRSSPVSYYLKLSGSIERAIDCGAYAPGDRLPSESDLCHDFELARSTVRQTLRHLADQGKIKFVPRRGAFVAKPTPSGWSLQVAQRSLEAEIEQHRWVETKVLEAGRCVLPDAAAEALELESAAAGFRMRRIQLLDGQLAIYSIGYLLPEMERVLRSNEVLNSGASLNRTLKAAGYETVRACRDVKAVATTQALSSLLDVQVGSPLVQFTSVSWGRDGKPFDFRTAWLRSDVLKVTVDVQASQNQPSALRR